MRIVYSNVGETEDLIGLFPYEPLHDMRRILEALDPRKHPTPQKLERGYDEIREAFNAIREHFLDEFEIEEPARPILVRSMRRKKREGRAEYAGRLLALQTESIQPVKERRAAPGE
jgi:superfamily II helicase